MCVSINGKDTNSLHLFSNDLLNGFRSTKTTNMSSSNCALLVIVIMNFSSTVLFICLIFLKWQVRGQDDSGQHSSLTVETQYLRFDMSQYGQDGGVFSSKYLSSPFIILFLIHRFARFSRS